MNTQPGDSSTPADQPHILLRAGLVLDTMLSRLGVHTLEDSANALLLLCESVSGAGAASAALDGFVPATKLPVPEADRKGVDSKNVDPMVSSFQDLQLIAEQANRRVWNASRYLVSGELHASLTAILIVEQQAYILNLGGNQIYLLSEKGIRTIRADAPRQDDGPDQEIYLGKHRDLAQLTAAGRPDFINSFAISLQPNDRLIICTPSLQKQLEASDLADRRWLSLAEIVRDCVRVYHNPADAARALSAGQQAVAVKGIWQPIPLPDAPAHTDQHSAAVQPAMNLVGGAVVLWNADQKELARTANLRRRRIVSQLMIGLLVLASILCVILAGASSAVGQQVLVARTAGSALSQTQTSTAMTPTSTATSTPRITATPLAILTLSPAATPTSTSIDAAKTPSRTARPTRVPTVTFTPSPTLIPTATSTPTYTPTHTPTSTPLSTSIPTPTCRPQIEIVTLDSSERAVYIALCIDGTAILPRE
jgi:hypothetical protein